MSWNDPSWKEAAQQYHEARGNKRLIVETPPERLRLLRRLLRGDVSLERAWSELNDPRTRPTPQAVIDGNLADCSGARPASYEGAGKSGAAFRM